MDTSQTNTNPEPQDSCVFLLFTFLILWKYMFMYRLVRVRDSIATFTDYILMYIETYNYSSHNKFLHYRLKIFGLKSTC